MPLRASSHPGSPNSPSCSALAWYSCWPGLSPWGESWKRTRVARTAALTHYRYATQPTKKWNGNRRLRTCQNFRISIWNWDNIWVNNRAIVMPHLSIFVSCWYVQNDRVTKILNSRSPGDTTIWKNLKPWCDLNNCTTQKYNVYWWERSSAI